MKMLSLVCAFFLLAQYHSTAQCNPSTQAGIHVVQSGETLFQIASKYKVSVSDICFWNSLNLNEIIPVCTKLKVANPNTLNRPTEFNTNSITDSFKDKSVVDISNYQKQAGNKHKVRKGETVAGLAELYGYTEARFRKFNAMGPREEVTVGSILLSSDCNCGRINFNNTSPSSANNSNNDAGNTATNTKPNNSSANTSTNTNTSTNNNDKASTSNSNSSKASASYMKPVELEMVDEINLLRSNPGGYIQHIQAYVTEQKNNNGFPISQSVVDELIQELRNTPKLSTLSPTACIYNAAKKHGDDILKMGKTDHVGSDGSWPWDRVRRECPQMSDGNENLVGGPSTVRASVVILLIDEGIPNRGHRKTLLNPKWNYVATHKIGQVGYMPNCWVQKFGAD